MEGAYGTGTSSYGGNIYDLQLMLGLGLTANSDIVSLYLEPQLGLAVSSDIPLTAGTDPLAPAVVASESYGLGYNVYAEIYITPIKNLEWYFEAEIGNVATGDSSNPTTTGLVFNGTTGITWYLPAL